jgi:uncharacterized protein (DUF885 family)
VATPFDQSETSNAIWADMNSKIEVLEANGDIDEAMASELREEAKTALLNHYKPAYENLIAWIEKELPNTEVAPTGVSRHPNGNEYYNYMLRMSTTTNLTADEIHNIGLREVERIQEEMLAIKNKVGFEGSFKGIF